MERGIKEGIYNNVIDMKVRNYFSSYSHSGFSALISNKLFERDNQTEWCVSRREGFGPSRWWPNSSSTLVPAQFRCLSSKSAKSLDDSSKSFAALIEKYISDFNGRAFRNGGRPLIGFIIRTLEVGDRLTRSRCACITLFSKLCFARYRAEGMKGLVLWLKSSYVLIQQATAGYIIPDTSLLKRRVRRSGGGFPKWIPAWQRRLMREGNIPAIRFWTSLTSLYRILHFPAQVSVKSIVAPGCNWEEILGTEGDQLLSECIKAFWAKLGLEKFQEMFRTLEIKFFAISKSSPVTVDWSLFDEDSLEFKGFKRRPKQYASVSTAWGPLGHTAYALFNVFTDVYSALVTYLRGSRDMAEFLGALRRVSWYTGSMPVLDKIDLAGTGVVPYPHKFSDKFPLTLLGKLGLKDEPAGKIRVFAMVDPWTQWVLHPLHRLIQNVLREISSDATFDQIGVVEAKLAEVQERNYRVPKAYSFDLSSATDRLPILLQERLLTPLIGAEKSRAWAELLVNRDYALPKRAVEDTGLSHVRYAVGQPMGALSSWVMLALTHHLIVQWAATRAGKLRFTWFSEYVVLGDDIVIFDPSVGREYLWIMKTLGVEVGLAKSLVSRKAFTFEFAKKLWVNGQRAFIVPFRDIIVSILSTEPMLEFMRKHGYTLNQYLKLRGLGFKARSKWPANLWNMPSRLRFYVVYYLSDKLTFLDWVSRKSFSANYTITREHLVKLVRYLYGDLETLIEKLESNRSSFGNPDVWTGDFVSLFNHFDRFDLFRYPISGIPDLRIKVATFQEWLNMLHVQLIAERETLDFSWLSYLDLAALAARIHQLISRIEDEVDKLSSVTLFTIVRREERTFSGIVPLYKRWVRYNGIFSPVKRVSTRPVPLQDLDLLVHVAQRDRERSDSLRWVKQTTYDPQGWKALDWGKVEFPFPFPKWEGYDIGSEWFTPSYPLRTNSLIAWCAGRSGVKARDSLSLTVPITSVWLRIVLCLPDLRLWQWSSRLWALFVSSITPLWVWLYQYSSQKIDAALSCIRRFRSYLAVTHCHTCVWLVEYAQGFWLAGFLIYLIFGIPDEPSAVVIQPVVEPGNLVDPLDLWLAFIFGMLGMFFLFSVYSFVTDTSEWEDLLDILRSMWSWEYESVQATEPPEIVSNIRFPSLRELIDWSNSRQAPGIVRSPQIGHGWSEPSSFNWDWPEEWR